MDVIECCVLVYICLRGGINAKSINAANGCCHRLLEVNLHSNGFHDVTFDSDHADNQPLATCLGVATQCAQRGGMLSIAKAGFDTSQYRLTDTHA
jgi:hypothetical protein